MHTKNIKTAGVAIDKAEKVLIMIHGRGGSATDILSLASHLDVETYALLAPQATNNTWYPYSFLAEPSHNEPWLSASLELLQELVTELQGLGIRPEQLYFLGFSQGACLMLEFITRNAARYGGAIAFTGGLIGDKIYRESYRGDFAGTPVFIGSANPDFHVPVERVYATGNILQELHADVRLKVYDNMGHTINQDEITQANAILNPNFVQ